MALTQKDMLKIAALVKGIVSEAAPAGKAPKAKAEPVITSVKAAKLKGGQAGILFVNEGKHDFKLGLPKARMLLAFLSDEKARKALAALVK